MISTRKHFLEESTGGRQQQKWQRHLRQRHPPNRHFRLTLMIRRREAPIISANASISGQQAEEEKGEEEIEEEKEEEEKGEEEKEEGIEEEKEAEDAKTQQEDKKAKEGTDGGKDCGAGVKQQQQQRQQQQQQRQQRR